MWGNCVSHTTKCLCFKLCVYIKVKIIIKTKVIHKYICNSSSIDNRLSTKGLITAEWNTQRVMYLIIDILILFFFYTYSNFIMRFYLNFNLFKANKI